MATLDNAFNALKSLGGKLRFFRDGWGLHENRHATWLEQTRTKSLPFPPVVNINWKTIPATDFLLGTFESPCAEFLPVESKKARVLHVPAPKTDALVVHLAATGEHGFVRRLLTSALWLRARGVSSLVLESPFYGSRKPRQQRGALLRQVHELPDLGRATIEESLALLHTFRKGGYVRQAVAGMSQGGLHAAMVSSLCQWPIGVVAAFAPHSAAPVFTRGVLSGVVDWEALGGDSQVVRDRLFRVLDVTDISNFPTNDIDNKQVLVFAQDDRYISHECVGAWRVARPRMRVEWVPGGHVSGAIWYYPTIRNAIIEVLPPSPDASGTGASSLASVGLHARCSGSSTQSISDAIHRDEFMSLEGCMQWLSMCAQDLQAEYPSCSADTVTGRWANQPCSSLVGL